MIIVFGSGCSGGIVMRGMVIVLTLAGFAGGGCASRGASPPCDLTATRPWIQRWMSAWDLTSRQILRLPDAPLPNLVFYDSSCVYTTSPMTAGVSANARGAAVAGAGLQWWAAKHDGTLTLPNAKKVPVQLMSFMDNDRRTGPFFVMAAPSFWTQFGHGQEPGLTAVFLHEMSHTRQLPSVAGVIGPIDADWKFAEELNDDVVQKRFGSDPAYVAAYMAERDLLHRAAAATSLADVRAHAAEALALMRRRHARWFTGENEVFATLDRTWLSMEGAGQ